MAKSLHESLEAGVSRRDDDFEKREDAVTQAVSPLWDSLWDSPYLPDSRPTANDADRQTTPIFTREQVVGIPPNSDGLDAGERTLSGFAWLRENGWLWENGWPGENGPKGRPRDRDALDALIAARQAFAWVPYRCLTIICEPPLELHTERVGREWRLHNDAGPAVVWAGGREDREYFLHGVRIPENLFNRDVRIQDLHYEASNEVRRVLIERMGWADYARRARLRLVASAPDPGNGDAELKLYALPRSVYDSNRLLMMVNGSPDTSGRHRDYAELVPDDYDDPIEAAAWQYGCPVDVYRELARRT
jgi:hypothetical protein